MWDISACHSISSNLTEHSSVAAGMVECRERIFHGLCARTAAWSGRRQPRDDGRKAGEHGCPPFRRQSEFSPRLLASSLPDKSAVAKQNQEPFT